MKKLLFVFAVAAAFAACNDSATSEAPKADSTAAPVQAAPDSTATTKADSTVKADSSAPKAVDSPKAAH
ncbi:MAG: hypothetical protein J7578_01240 [Chitinophagaceae bacterium]|nr:hypothetical protein [Chitinophagaceae bacterium]